MFGANQLKVATIERQHAHDIQTLCCGDDQRVNEVEIGICVKPQDLCGPYVVFSQWRFKGLSGGCKTCDEFSGCFASYFASQ